MPLNIVLYQPEIPANTGNIGRLCVGANARLHLVKPMKFFLTDKYIKRAGLDYWEKLDLQLHNSWETFLEFSEGGRKIYFTTKTDKKYTSFQFQKDDFLIFGPESRGIPENILKANWDNALTIPMSSKIRSINLSNSVAVVVYEAIRQLGGL
ncbi:MAG: tRNA (uridine(34)/cytosine(34)/5-carboxymethylaminomethyluridine(34)-2'-O)-methyltransferase TrmL [Candidatus Cloacimonadota bacterium]|nr:tRNA (uridine(34)/cytosine(34)/5-carboxymethylaminomethyluridine(34)-2'-O)-methyltransferase TrmL [Candidatus Cloacimonadota bacterium]